MPPYRQRVVAPPARPAGRFARGAAPPLWQSAGFGSVGCPPPPCAPCAASARLGLALAAPPFSAGAWLRGGSRRGNWDSAACGRRGKDTPLGFPAHTLPYRCGKPTTLSTVTEEPAIGRFFCLLLGVFPKRGSEVSLFVSFEVRGESKRPGVFRWGLKGEEPFQKGFSPLSFTPRAP